MVHGPKQDGASESLHLHLVRGGVLVSAGKHTIVVPNVEIMMKFFN